MKKQQVSNSFCVGCGLGSWHRSPSAPVSIGFGYPAYIVENSPMMPYLNEWKEYQDMAGEPWVVCQQKTNKKVWIVAKLAKPFSADVTKTLALDLNLMCTTTSDGMLAPVTVEEK